MDSSRSSNSTLTMLESRSRPQSSSDLLGFREVQLQQESNPDLLGFREVRLQQESISRPQSSSDLDGFREVRLQQESFSRPQSSSDLLGFRESRLQQNYRRHRRRSSNLSGIYKSPQINAGLRQSATSSHRSILNTCLLLTPAVAFQFCTGLTSVFSIVNLHLLQIPMAVASAHLIVAAILSIGLTTAFQKFVRKLFEHPKHLAMLLICFTAYLSLGTLFVIVANTERMLNSDVIILNGTENATSTMPPLVVNTSQMELVPSVLSNENYQFENLSANTERDTLYVSSNMSIFDAGSSVSNKSSWQRVVVTTPVPLYSKIMAFFGYVIMSSSLSSSHYLLCCIATSFTHVDDHKSISTIEATAAALGGCAVSFLGAINLSFSWHSSKESSHLLIGHIFILLCIAFILLIGCTTCSLITCFGDVIVEKFRPTRIIEEHIVIGRNRRPTRTAQEIFDECAVLLGHRERVPYTDEYSPTRNLPTDYDEGSIAHSETAMEDSVLPSQADETSSYVIQLPVPVREQHQSKSWKVCLKKQKTFFRAFLLMSLVSGCLVSVEYNSSVYLSYLTQDHDDLSGHSYIKGVRASSAGTFLTYLVFIVALCFYESSMTQLGLKTVVLGTGVTASVLTLALAISNEVPVFFAVACVLGLMRALVISLHRHVSVQSQIGFQTITVRQILIDTPSTAAWCMTPLSLCLASTVSSALAEAPGFHEISVYYSATSALLACVTVFKLF